MWYINTMEYYSDIKGVNYTTCSNIDEHRGYHTKRSQKEKDKYHMITYMWDLGHD